MRMIVAGGRTIVVARVGGVLYAIDGLCSHRKGELWKGELVGTTVTCPRHGSQFDIRSGRKLKDPWIPLAKASDLHSYELTEEEGEAFVEM